MKNLYATMERVEATEDSGWMTYGRIPLKIYYNLHSESSEGFNERNPGENMVTQDIGGGESLSVWIHESVPDEFVDTVLYHELIEAELQMVNGLDIKEAHRHAIDLEYEYVKRFLGEKRLVDFKRWKIANLDKF